MTHWTSADSSADTSNANYMAAVDLGSNSFHMVIARVVDGALQLLHREKQKVQLAEGLNRGFTADRRSHVTWSGCA